MSLRKPTLDGLDDIDDEDGVAEQEARQETDLSVRPRLLEDVGPGGAGSGEVEESESRGQPDENEGDESEG